MQTKLTLRLDEKLIKSAKLFAKKNGKSVSQIVADYFALLEGKRQEPKTITLTPTVRSLKGALRGADVDTEDYHRHLEGKYL
jgi:hypothetical protein